MSKPHSDDGYVWGQAIQEAMAARGCEMTLDESRQFVRELIELICLWLIDCDHPPCHQQYDDGAAHDSGDPVSPAPI